MNVLIKGLVTRLRAAAGVTALVGQNTFMDAPQGQSFPYITLDISGDEAHRKDSLAQTYQIVVNSWSRLKTMEQADKITQAVKAALNRQESLITLDSGTLVRLDFISEDCYKDPDGVTWHGVSIFNAYIDLGG